MNFLKAHGVNLSVVGLVALVTFFTGYMEGYFPLISPLFWAIIAGGIVVTAWLACTISTVRLLALIVVIFVVEYVKESIGVVNGFWHYARPSYTFGVWCWVVGGFSAIAVGKLLAKVIAMLKPSLPKGANAAMVIIAAILGFALLGPYRSHTGAGFWLFYAALLSIALFVSFRVGFPEFASLVAAAVAVGALSEYSGAIGNNLWTFAYDRHFPPLFLLLGCWPIEITMQYLLSGAIAGELSKS